MSSIDRISEEPDFEARIRFLSSEEGGRKSQPFQGYVCDFKYESHYEGDPPNQAWMIYPAFLDEQGALLPELAEIPTSVSAIFRVLDPHYRETVHRKRMHVGTRFWLVEGSRRVAEGVITKFVGMADEHPD